MIVKWLLAKLLGNLFGEGFAADLAGRGVVFLSDNARSAIRHDEERVTRTRIEPGETYTVIARPRPGRRERKLAASQRSVEQRYERASRPTRSQLRAAKRLSRTQHRLDGSGSARRRARLERREMRRGVRFDHVMRPKRRQLRLARELTRVTDELTQVRERNFDEARRARQRSHRRPRVRVYD